MSRLPVFLALWLALGCTACWTNFNGIPGVKKLTTPKPGPKTSAFLDNYCTDHERPVVRKGTPLAQLLWEDECGNGMMSCATGLDAAKGRLPAPYEQLFRDLLDAKQQETGGPRFVYQACDITSGEEPYALAIDGLGLMRSEKHADFLVEFIHEHGRRYFTDTSTPRRLVDAMFLIGKSDAFEDTYALMLDMHPRVTGFRPEALKYLATWESDAGVDYCMKTLREGKGAKQACIWYLGQRRHKEAYELIVRRMEDEQEEGIRALGHLGDPRAIERVGAVFRSTKDASSRMVAAVALANLGEMEAFPEFERSLRGRYVLSSGKEASNVRVKLIEAATLEALELHDAALRSQAFEVVAGLGEPESSSGWRVPVVLNAARGSLGEADAVQALATMLDDPRKDVRHLVVQHVGANFEQLHGLRVPDRSLYEPLTRAYEMEPNALDKSRIIAAVAFLGADGS